MVVKLRRPLTTLEQRDALLARPLAGIQLTHTAIRATAEADFAVGKILLRHTHQSRRAAVEGLAPNAVETGSFRVIKGTNEPALKGVAAFARGAVL